ncbi:O-acetylhomoserine aminocarboxypropyltransferase/cysteine synthase family protein [Campylobacter sp. MG1]|uniref:O-acetylhomoserine aminocarboxypropyltransferase/cysteine synthase family protein n=1 Tax=Campylobacter sp. MG1 TaxID=2976332 RepID=UPI00226CFFDB|nr:O-acetylhomoserine aminocarboxypropyltransferase/cysteine synthase family protein [Campylobacter sp. MG1]
MYQLETNCIHGGYSPKNGESRQIPIIPSTTFKYESTEQMGRLFDLAESGYFYSRVGNPTCDHVAARITKLEGGAAGILTSSGQAAIFYAIVNLCKAGDHLICTNEVYGGTYNLIAVTLKKFGIESTFLSVNSTNDEIKKAIQPNTKLIYAETVSNPSLAILDIERFAKVAHENNLPLVIDNTFPTPINCQPIKYGADIVIHSATKYLDGHSSLICGVVIDSGKFNWECDKVRFAELCEPDESYHGLIYTKQFGNIAYLVKMIVQLMRDIGACNSANNAYMLGTHIESLPLRIKKHSDNALAVAKFLEGDKRIKSVNCPMLPSSKYYDLAKKYLPNGICGVISFELNANKEKTIKFLDSLKLISIATHVADAKSCALHPASHTHRQLSPVELKAAGVSEGLIRISVGIENENDIISDIKQALDIAFS